MTDWTTVCNLADIDPDTGFRFYGSEIARCR